MAESRKSTKKVSETDNVAGNQLMPFWSNGKMKKFCGKLEKAYFFCGKPETDP